LFRAAPAILLVATVVASCGSRTGLVDLTADAPAPPVAVTADAATPASDGATVPRGDGATPGTTCPMQRTSDVGVWCCSATCGILTVAQCCPPSECAGGTCGGAAGPAQQGFACDDLADCSAIGQRSGSPAGVCCGYMEGANPVAICLATSAICSDDVGGETLCFPGDTDPCPQSLGTGTRCLPARNPHLLGYYSCQ
jgi:hypothetical protein